MYKIWNLLQRCHSLETHSIQDALLSGPTEKHLWLSSEASCLVKKQPWAGEMGQWVRAPDCSSEGPEFKSQQPHGGSQPSVTRSDSTLLECLKTATVYLHIINK